jgi:2-polyprenyl-3-methyl-5-hydroxy-6-metoxy-1,4-benzoquinol methylase
MNSRELKEMLPESMRRRLGAVKRRLWTMPLRTRWQKAKLLSTNSLNPAQLALLTKTESRIAPKDDMLVEGDVDHYFKAGLSAIGCIEEALQEAGSITVKEILDLPSGYGRVQRLLVHRFPKARITACDLMPEAIRFCAETFGATPTQSSYNLEELSFATKFDFIWCGSLITHLGADRTRALLRFFAKHLTAKGLLVLSTHGDSVPARFDMAEFFGLSPSSIPHLVKAFHEQGHGYVDYPGQSGYGISLIARTWMITEALEVGLTEVYFRAHGWDNFQDVFGFVKHSSV